MNVSKDIDDNLLGPLAVELGYFPSEDDGPKEFAAAIKSLILDKQLDPLIKRLTIKTDPDIIAKQAELHALIQSKIGVLGLGAEAAVEVKG